MSIISSPIPDIDIPEVSLSDFLMPCMKQHGHQTALIEPDTGRHISYPYLCLLIHKLSSGLHQQGVKKGDVICLLVPNSVEYPAILLATIALGAIVTPTNPLLTEGEILNHLEDSQSSYVVTVPDILLKVENVCRRYSNIKKVFTVGYAEGYVTVNDLVQLGQQWPLPRVNINPREDIAILPYSSGTTGKSKGVMLTHYNIVSNILQHSHPSLCITNRGEVYIAVLPLFHMYGISIVCLLSLYFGNSLVILSRFNLNKYLQAIQKYKPAFLHIVPPIANLLTHNPMAKRFDVTSVTAILSGAAPLPNEQSDALKKKLNIKNIYQGYGCTEASPGTHICPRVGAKLGSVGILLPNTEAKVLDVETGKILGPYKLGEICVRGPQVMKGYLSNTVATALTIDKHGWLKTGDVGYYDEDQHFFIVDRIKELIKYKGFQVAPAELESLLLTHAAVADAAVIGLPDSDAGELPCAYIVRKGNITEEDLIQFVKGQVAPHKQLRGGVQFVDQIPKSPAGKILRRVLKAETAKKTKHAIKSKL